MVLTKNNITGFELREWARADAGSLKKHADNKKIAMFLRDRFPSPYTIDDAVYWVNLVQNRQPVTNFAIVVDGAACGDISVELMDDINRMTAEIGFWLGEDYWGRGIVTHAVELVTRYVFENLPVIRIEAYVHHKNLASMRVLEKAGFLREGVLRSAICKNNEIADKHVFSILK